MLPNLLAATTTYWQKLDHLEEMYQRGDISLDEVDRRVTELLVDLGEERRLAVVFVWRNIQLVLPPQRDAVAGFGLIALITYGWALRAFVW